MSVNGVGNLIFIDGIMDKNVYLNILKINIKENAQKMGLENDFYFQQDNDPKHTAWVVRMWLLYNAPKMLVTPPQSPDINPIEHLWSYLEEKIRLHSITSRETLKAALMQEWDRIPKDYCQKLVKSMPKRLAAIKAANGYPTKY